MQGIELRIKGKVQGVGFRPFVWLLANQYGLNGDVNNDGQGVLIRFVSPPADAACVLSFVDEPPHPAKVPAATAAANTTLTSFFFITVSLSFPLIHS